MTVKTITKKSAKKLVATINRKTARANKAFEALSPEEKRVTIARDVLAQLRDKTLIPRPGYWLNGVNDTGIFTVNQIKKNPELCDVLKGVKQCEGCALGGLFMCAVKKFDRLKLDQLEGVRDYNDDVQYAKDDGYPVNDVTLDVDGITSTDAFNYLERFFSSQQLDLIESCFERNLGETQSDEANNFIPEVNDPSERKRLIMENIITNKGKFCPEKLPVLVYQTPGFVG
jgi:hypothetical protein